MSGISRRGFLGGLALAGMAPLFPSMAFGSSSKRSIRVAHMTDFHVQPELNAPKGMAMALDHAMSHKPDLIICGGDLVMAAFAHDETRTALQWKIFQDLIREKTKVPVHYTLGNHDVWGWNKKDSHTTGSEAKWGKKWFCDNFEYNATYHSFDLGGWHFVILDNIFLTPDGFNGKLGPEQLEWLDADLARTSKPTLVCTHIPLLSVTTLAGSYNEKEGEWRIGGDDMTKDLSDLMKIFANRSHVKVALCGHEHQVDRVDFKGVNYMCGGAVCGAWWKGPNNGFEPGYRLVDLRADGTFEEKYVTWGWTKDFLLG